MNQRFLQALRYVAKPFFGKGLWKAPGLRSVAGWYRKAYRPEFVMVEASRLYLNYDDGLLSSYLAVHGYWEKTETELVRRHVKPGMRVLDIGANVGYFTLLMSALVGPEGEVIAFEPDTTNFTLLQKSVGELRHRNVRLNRAAVWSVGGELDLYLNPDNHGDHRCYGDGEGRVHYTIPAVAVDDYVGGEGGFDFIKMDIQGAEGHALAGMRRMLDRHRPQAIIMEFWPQGLMRAGTPPEEVYARIVELGYTTYAIEDEANTVRPITFREIMEYCDLDWKFVNLLCV